MFSIGLSITKTVTTARACARTGAAGQALGTGQVRGGVPSRVRFSLICNKGRGGQLRSFELPQVPASDCASASLRPRQRRDDVVE